MRLSKWCGTQSRHQYSAAHGGLNNNISNSIGRQAQLSLTQELQIAPLYVSFVAANSVTNSPLSCMDLSFIDSRASRHMTDKHDFIFNLVLINPYSLGLPNWSSIMANHEGFVCLGPKIILTHVSYVLNLLVIFFLSSNFCNILRIIM